MGPQEIERFFVRLDKELNESVVVILTGAAAGSILGNIRSSADIDFAIQPVIEQKSSWQKIEEALKRTTTSTGITAQYALDIDRWSMISFLNYRETALPYKKFGQIEVCILEPSHWAIGKFARYLELDMQDLVVVLKKNNIEATGLLTLLGLAMKASTPSGRVFQFRQHVEHFLRTYGHKVWGTAFNPDEATRQFHQCAGIST